MVNYFLEIKNRTFLIFFTCSHLFFICYSYKELLLFTLTQHNKFLYFIFTDVTEIFSVYIQIVFFIQIQILTIYICYHSFIFLNTALFHKEYHLYYSIFRIITIVWFFLIILSTQFLIPIAWNFFLSFQNANFINLHFETKLKEYINFYISFYYSAIGYGQIIFLLPYFLYKVFSITGNIKLLRRTRKLFYCFFIIFSTAITPPEITSQLFISFILIFTFELFIFSFMLKHYFNSLIRQPIKTN